MAHQLRPDELIPGRTYRIESTDGTHVPFLGRLIAPERQMWPYPRWREFDSVVEHPSSIRIVHDWGKIHPTKVFPIEVSHTRFYESGMTMVATQVARQLSKKIPENSAGLIERFAIAKGPGPNRYESRVNNTNSENAENNKKPNKRSRGASRKRKSRR